MADLAASISDLADYDGHAFPASRERERQNQTFALNPT